MSDAAIEERGEVKISAKVLGALLRAGPFLGDAGAFYCRYCQSQVPVSGHADGCPWLIAFDALHRAYPVGVDPIPNDETRAMLDLLGRPNEDEDGDFISLSDEGWAVVHAFLARYGRDQ